MAASTPPKGRPTAGRRDRQVARHRSQSRSTTKKFVYGVLALTVLAALLVLGTGTGSDVPSGGNTNMVLPLLVLSRFRRSASLAPRS